VVKADEAPKQAKDPVVQRTITGMSAPGSALRARLNAAASDLAGSGYSPREIAALIEAGEHVE
jgi:hypothetical protein